MMKEEDSAVLQSRLNKKRKHPLGAQARPKNVLHSSSTNYYALSAITLYKAGLYGVKCTRAYPLVDLHIQLSFGCIDYKSTTSH